MIKEGSHVQGNIIDQIYVDETKFNEIKVSKTAWYYCDHLGYTIDFKVWIIFNDWKYIIHNDYEMIFT